MSTRTNSTKRILGAVRPSEDRTLASVAKAAGVPVPVARLTLGVLTDLGLVQVARVKQTGKRGRPAFMYRKVA